MTTKLLLIVSVMTLVMVISVGQATDAFADGKIRLTSGANVTTIVDQGAGDINGVDGITKTIMTVGVFDLDITATSLSKPLSGSAIMPDIDHDIQTTSSAGGTLLYEFTDVDFTGLVLTCRNFGGGTTDGNVTYTVYIDPGNVEFAQTTQVFQTVHGPGPAALITLDLTNNIQPGGQFSVTVVSEIVHFGFGDSTSHDIRTVCEPLVAGELLPISTHSLMLGGVGLSLMWIVPVLASAGGAVAYIKYKRT